MKVHLRFGPSNPSHTLVTVFVNGANSGNLIMSPAQALWFHHILEAGCRQLSPKGRTTIDFVSSGHPPDPPVEEIESCVKEP